MLLWYNLHVYNIILDKNAVFTRGTDVAVND